MKITLSVPMVPLSEYGFFDVEAELLFYIAPHLAHMATFAIHKAPYLGETWHVSNVETGCRVTEDMSRAKAIKKAADILKRKSPAEMEIAYSTALKQLLETA